MIIIVTFNSHNISDITLHINEKFLILKKYCNIEERQKRPMKIDERWMKKNVFASGVNSLYNLHSNGNKNQNNKI